MYDYEVAERLAELVALPVGWDSYHADCQPVAQDTADRAARLLKAVKAPPSNVVPIASDRVTGAWVQAEWYLDGQYVEVEVTPYGYFNVMACPEPNRKSKIQDIGRTFDETVALLTHLLTEPASP
jgi:hypothetical protein